MDDSPDSVTPALPDGARRFIAAVTVAGLGLLLVATVMSRDLEPGVPLATLVALLGLSMAGTLLPLRIHHKGGAHGFNLTTGVTVGLIAVVPDPLALPLLGIAAGLSWAAVTRSPVKTAFNVGQEVLCAGAAVLVGRAVLGGDIGGDVLTPLPAVAVVAAVAAASITNLLLMVELFHRLNDQPRRAVLRQASGLVTLVSMVGDTLAAVLVVVLVDRSPLALFLAWPLFGGLLLGYRGAEVSRESGRLASAMHGTSRTLLAGAVDDGAFEEAIDGLRGMFRAETAVLDLVDGERPALEPGLAAALDSVVRTGQPELDTGDGDVLAVPVVLEGRIIGALAVAGRRGLDAWDEADLALLGTVAGEVAAALRARQLLADVERERASLAVESQRLGDILHGASDGILLLDDLGRVEACNPAMGAVVGRLPEDVIGRRWDDVLRLEDADGRPIHAASGDGFSRALAGLGGAIAEVRLRQSDGGWRWLRCSVAPVTRDDEHVGVVLVAVDLTTQRQVDELRGDFLATVSHELRTPLTPLKGFLTLLATRHGELEGDRLTSIHDSMGKQLDRLEDLIGDLLLVAELDGGSPRVQIEPIELAPVVEDVVATEAPVPAMRSRLDVEMPDVRVLGDAVALRRVLRGLVSNGLKHTDGDVRVRGRVAGRQVVVEVEDDGPGIPDQDRDAVFEPFRRLGNHLHRPQGPGLGLAIARSLADACGGSLTLAPRAAERGACFVLRLPHDAIPEAGRHHRRHTRGDAGVAR